jgi:hypothetical protein
MAANELAAAQVLQAAARHQLYVQDFGPVSVIAEGIDSDYVSQHINPLLEQGLEALLREVERVGEVGVSPDADSSTVLNPTRWLAQWLMRNNTGAVSNDDQSDLVAFAHRKHDEILHETGDSRAWIRTLVATQSAVDQQFNGLSMRDVFRAMDQHRDGRVSVDDFVNGATRRYVALKSLAPRACMSGGGFVSFCSPPRCGSYLCRNGGKARHLELVL